MTTERINLLNIIGFVWNVQPFDMIKQHQQQQTEHNEQHQQLVLKPLGDVDVDVDGTTPVEPATPISCPSISLSSTSNSVCGKRSSSMSSSKNYSTNATSV
jgi:hypothetical protein